MTIKASIIADSIGSEGVRLVTMELRYPRFIHAELMTHRVFSRNASSSRAIPVTRMLEDIRRELVFPSYWGKNQAGMQAREEMVHKDQRHATRIWRDAAEDALQHAERLSAIGAHKQIVNRLLEPFAHINVIVTATDWDNFFELRDHPDAQPEIGMLAREMRAAMNGSVPTGLGQDQWHIPYIENSGAPITELLMASAARCARVSYKTHDGRTPSLTEDLVLSKRLLESRHMSPFEHVATPVSGRHANFRGWKSLRSLIESNQG